MIQHFHHRQSNHLTIILISFSAYHSHTETGGHAFGQQQNSTIQSIIVFQNHSQTLLNARDGRQPLFKWQVVEQNQTMDVNILKYSQKQYFNVTHNIDLNVNDENDNQVNIFGHQFSNNRDARILYSSILWFTYRENLQFRSSDITSDVGWGCMLRVGQMAIGEALRRTLGVQNYGNLQTVKEILSYITQKKGLFSIENMTQKGMQIFEKGAGSWFTPAQTATILKQIQNSELSSELRVLVYNNEFETESALQTLRDTNLIKSNEISQNFIIRNKAALQKSTNISIFPGLIIVLVRIGINNPQPEMLKTLFHIMRFPSFMGLLGGKTSLAHYIVGFTNKNFIYLDPHYVKQNTGNIEDYFGTSMFAMPHERIDTSMGICFFVKDYGEFIRLCDDLLSLNNKVFYTHSLIQQTKIVEIAPCEKFELLKE